MSDTIPKMRRWRSVPTLLTLLATALFASTAEQPQPPRRHLLIVVDGLRPDYVTPAVMPNLVALGARGVVFRHHHSIFPTVTRLNGASISTGAYPEIHGLLGNSVFFPRVDRTKFLDTSNRDALARITEVEGRLLTAPTLGETLQAAGRRMLAISSGSAGSGILPNHSVAGGAVLHTQFTMPAGIDMAAAGPQPAAGAPPGARDRYAVDSFLKVGIPRFDPTVTVLWLGELDATAHDKGIGSPDTVAVLRRVDIEIKRVQDGLAAAGLLANYDIWVTSDHGFSTYGHGVNVAALLAPFRTTLPDGAPSLVQGGGAIYLRDDNQSTIAAVVAALQRTSGIGAIFTPSARPESLDGRVPGTLSFDSVRWAHDRSAQILFSPDWTDEANAFGVRGTETADGTAGHGSTSPWDVHNALIAAGPDLRRHAIVDIPSANVDFAPTFLKLLGIRVPSSMQGRSLDEALVNGRAPGSYSVGSLKHTASTDDGRYSVTASFSMVSIGGESFRYFDQTSVTRK